MSHYRNISTIMAAALLMGCASFPQSEPIVDGAIGELEWDGSESFPMSGGGSARILRHGSRLYLAVSATAAGFPTIFVASRESVDVFHSSAAQGKVRYRSSGGFWHATTTKFDYELRESASGEQPPEQVRATYLEKHGWISTSSSTPAKEREFRIDLQPGQNFIAVAFLEIPSLRITSWPAQISDATTSTELLRGEVPSTLMFDVLRWHNIEY